MPKATAKSRGRGARVPRACQSFGGWAASEQRPPQPGTATQNGRLPAGVELPLRRPDLSPRQSLLRKPLKREHFSHDYWVIGALRPA